MSRKQNKGRPLKEVSVTQHCRECGQVLTAPKTAQRRLCRSCWRVHKAVTV